MIDKKEEAENRKTEELEKIDIINVVAEFLSGLQRLWLAIGLLIVVCTLSSYFVTRVSYTPHYGLIYYVRNNSQRRRQLHER